MELWSSNHVKTLLPSFIIMLILGVILRIFLKNKPEKIRFIPLQVCAIIIVVLEIIKQTLSIIKGYDLYHIPLHFCSLFIYLLPLMAFYRGKYKEKIRAVTTTACGALFMLMAIYPSVIYSGEAIAGCFDNFWDFHTTVFHVVATFAFVIIVFLELHEFNCKKDILYIAVFFLAYCVIAGSFAQIIQTNFNNFYKCNVPPIEDLRQSLISLLGYGFAQTLYVFIVSVVNLIFVTLSYYFYVLFNKVVNALNNKIIKK